MVCRSILFLALAAQISLGATPSPIADAAERGNRGLVRTLIQQRANVNAAQGDGMTALHWAAMNDDVALAQMLIEGKADLNPVTRLGSYTPLYLAAKNGNAAVADVLMKAGADTDRVSSTGATVLMVAAASGSTKLVE